MEKAYIKKNKIICLNRWLNYIGGHCPSLTNKVSLSHTHSPSPSSVIFQFSDLTRNKNDNRSFYSVFHHKCDATHYS